MTSGADVAATVSPATHEPGIIAASPLRRYQGAQVTRADQVSARQPDPTTAAAVASRASHSRPGRVMHSCEFDIVRTHWQASTCELDATRGATESV